MVKAYHSAFFHGICGRDGEWFPHDTRGVDAETTDASPLTVQYNRYNLASLTWPGSWPVIGKELAIQVNAFETVRCSGITINKVIEQEWHVNKSIDIEPADLTAKELYARFPAVDPSKEPERFELKSYRLCKVARDVHATEKWNIEFGTPPMLERQEINCSAALLEKYQILAISGSLLITRSVFDLFVPHVTPQFFNVREYRFA